MKKCSNKVAMALLGLLLMSPAFFSCSTQKKLSKLRKNYETAKLVLPQEESYMPELNADDIPAQRDTLTITGLNGETVQIMKAIKDDDGNMVAHEVLDAAVVTARFRNVAERRGSVEIEFQIRVPESMQDGTWQLRFYPDMFIMGDSLRLEPVIITGKDYRKEQLRGYQQYEKFLRTIITDTTKFINVSQLEIFLQRNIPELYALKSDTTYVSDEVFYSIYGLTEKKAVDHYTYKLMKRRNEYRKSRKDRMFRKLVKAPIVSEGLRLDTVMQAINGEFVYNYVQTVHTRPKLRKVDIVLSGDIYEEDIPVYKIPKSEPLTFYISSLSAFVDNTERYRTKIIERRAEANASSYIDFETGKADVREDLSNNREEINNVKKNLASLLENEEFDLDSIVVESSASPEGTQSYNSGLSWKRSNSITKYFDSWMKHYSDSLESEKGFSVDEFGNIVKEKKVRIEFKSRAGGENWTMLDELVENDTTLTDEQKKDYIRHKAIQNWDLREKKMKETAYYAYVKENLYPKLRTVKFSFHLHRKGMIKDTIHTTELDTVYMAGVQAIRDRDYEKAINILRPYNDYNTAIAYVSMDYNESAMAILKELERSAQVNYMLALLYSRKGDDQNAVECYVHSCEQDPSYVHRGNLDPEIAALIKKYNLNAQPEDEFDYSF